VREIDQGEFGVFQWGVVSGGPFSYAAFFSHHIYQFDMRLLETVRYR
jgi:hypothetical protein